MVRSVVVVSSETVCVLEAGIPDRHPLIRVPVGFVKTLYNPAFTWPFQAAVMNIFGVKRTKSVGPSITASPVSWNPRNPVS